MGGGGGDVTSRVAIIQSAGANSSVSKWDMNLCHFVFETAKPSAEACRQFWVVQSISGELQAELRMQAWKSMYGNKGEDGREFVMSVLIAQAKSYSRWVYLVSFCRSLGLCCYNASGLALVWEGAGERCFGGGWSDSISSGFQFILFSTWLAPRWVQAASAGGWAFIFHMAGAAMGLSAREVSVCLIHCHEAKVELGGGRSKRSPASNQRRGSACLPCPPVHMPGQHSASCFPPSVGFCVLVTLLMLETW